MAVLRQLQEESFDRNLQTVTAQLKQLQPKQHNLSKSEENKPANYWLISEEKKTAKYWLKSEETAKDWLKSEEMAKQWEGFVSVGLRVIGR